MCSSTLIFDLGTRRGEGSESRRCRTLPPAKTRYPFYRRLCGSQGRSGQVRKISPSPGFDPRSVQPVGSRYTEYVTRPTQLVMYWRYIDVDLKNGDVMVRIQFD